MNKLMIVLLASTLLGGCQSLFGKSAKLEVRPAGATIAVSAAISLEEGRQHLLRGEPASAIVALRLATVDPATAAPAHNGLGVAYAMLGRGDLAERYFQRAVEQGPDDPRFAANLSKFYASREAMFAKAEAAKAVAVVAIAEPAEAAPAAIVRRTLQAGPSVVRIDLPTPAEAMTRVSGREVVIRTHTPQPPAAMADARRRNPRFSAVAAARPASSYPVRIELPAARR